MSVKSLELSKGCTGEDHNRDFIPAAGWKKLEGNMAVTNGHCALGLNGPRFDECVAGECMLGRRNTGADIVRGSAGPRGVGVGWGRPAVRSAKVVSLVGPEIENPSLTMPGQPWGDGASVGTS